MLVCVGELVPNKDKKRKEEEKESKKVRRAVKGGMNRGKSENGGESYCDNSASTKKIKKEREGIMKNATTGKEYFTDSYK